MALIILAAIMFAAAATIRAITRDGYTRIATRGHHIDPVKWSE
ncbi:putative RNA binding protein YcfA (HicA-like mRNA interferase family) [Cryobacterium sp. MP_M5]|nr:MULTISPECIES: hypothetical protein [unclassified Cryobacterium]MBG6058163.1 putative RNA binding protein YcfA (HicA-like mRNA interferase family) [Cryobacterium sp. MP_M3]MEC5176593.1 putative RNA binding protein YcfA (HicA-like mRNA interferase family) [Cryobacterium sp. MP_M5]